MTVISRPRNRYGFLFGTGADGDVTISANTNLTSVLNGDIVYRNYMNLTINSGCTLSVSNPCRGLWIRVRGVLTLNGDISMTGKAGFVSGGGSDLYLCFDDIKIPITGGAYGAAPAHGNNPGNDGTDGSDGSCGGGASGGSAHRTDERRQRGARGSAGYLGGGGVGGGGGAASTDGGWYQINQGSTLPLNGGDYGANEGNGGFFYVNGSRDDSWRTSNGTGGKGLLGGGILILMANEIIGNGKLISKGQNGTNGSVGGSEWGMAIAAGGGGSGGGSETLFYARLLGNPVFEVNGGLGGVGGNYGAKGGDGGAGSCRDYSLAELLSHTRV